MFTPSLVRNPNGILAPRVVDVLRHFIASVVALLCEPVAEPVSPSAGIAEEFLEGAIERGEMLGETYRRPDPKHVAHGGST